MKVEKTLKDLVIDEIEHLIADKNSYHYGYDKMFEEIRRKYLKIAYDCNFYELQDRTEEDFPDHKNEQRGGIGRMLLVYINEEKVLVSIYTNRNDKVVGWTDTDDLFAAIEKGKKFEESMTRTRARIDELIKAYKEFDEKDIIEYLL